ncbi:MAG: chemotaxis protein CheA [Spirochaetales bacterium]|nr:chemotaxis protein CheA [Spirochaetales bacterium]
MTAESFFVTLGDSLNSFTPGDLVGTMELKELVDEGRDYYPSGEKALFLDLSALLHCYILEGENDELNKQFQSIKERIVLIGHSEPVADSPEREAVKNTVPLCPNPVRIDDREVLDSFLQESHDHLDTIEERILALETNPDADLIDDIFRSMHTIKGVASFIGLNNIKNISHTLESLLDRLRDNELAVDSDLINVLLDGTDILSGLIGNIEQEAEEKRDSGNEMLLCEPPVDISLLVEKIARIGNDDGKMVPQKPAEAPVPSDSVDDLITGEMIQKFIEETSDLIDSAEHEILELENGSPEMEHVDRAFRKLHTIKGNAGFFGFASIEETAMETESLLDEIRKGIREADHRNVSLLLKEFDIIRARLSSPVEDRDGGSEKTENYKPIGEVLADLGVSREDIEHAANLQNKKLGEILVEEGVVSEGILDKALQSQGRTAGDLPSISVKRKDIRIDMEKLDRLFDMVGELITAEAMVVDSEDLKGLELRDFQKSALHLSKITREIQSITMSMRMIPLEGLFNKMKRLVRDLSRKMDKPVQLQISGADTEMDRNVIEEISDPLVHIIRNAIDHGLENRSERSGKGKPPVGTVKLNARYEGNEIWITVSDDGAGLNRKGIVIHALEKGLLGEGAESLPDEDIWKLIFEPGFSTMEKVSEISGRGVGMDVVKKNIEKLRGRIDINTEWGKGTDMVLRIPLTLAIIDAISCRVATMTLAFQSSDVIEFLKYSDDLFTHTGQGNRVINLRSEIIPVIDLREFYNIKRDRQKDETEVIVVITAGGVKSALVVDSILGSKQMVVKALPELLEETRAISGCSVLGTGDVCLIVDAAALIGETLE